MQGTLSATLQAPLTRSVITKKAKKMNADLEPLFKFDTDGHNNACLNYMRESTYLYVEGYKRAANELVKRIDQTGLNQDTFVYPIVFLYRHYLELTIKGIIDKGSILLENGSGHPKHHNLETLWPMAKGIIRIIWQQGDPEEFTYVEHIIKEITNVDPVSMSFRYPKDKVGKNCIPALTYINTRHLSEMINKASDFLSGIEVGIEEYLEYKYSY